jgi:hypothetical protein
MESGKWDTGTDIQRVSTMVIDGGWSSRQIKRKVRSPKTGKTFARVEKVGVGGVVGTLTKARQDCRKFRAISARKDPLGTGFESRTTLTLI